MEKISKEFVIDVHNNIIEEFGGMSGIKDDGALDSSINNAFTTFFGEDLYKTDIDKIGNIFYLLNKNHCFNDANKRTAVVMFNVLTKINNIDIQYKIKELEILALNVAEDKVDLNGVSKWINNHLEKLD